MIFGFDGAKIWLMPKSRVVKKCLDDNQAKSRVVKKCHTYN